MVYIFQLYVFKDRKLTEKLVKRAEKAGYKALLLTCGTPRLEIRYGHTRNGFRLPPHLKLANFESNDVGPMAQHVVDEDTQNLGSSGDNDQGISFSSCFACKF
jgi:(S)-2-hydroxy-acid oxidase